MNLSMLDREQLEDILLNPPRVEVHPLQCSDSITLDCLPTGPAERSTRIRHVLAAAHELLVRSANAALVGRCLLDSPTLVKNYFKVHFAGAERETFVVVFLDSQMRVIATEELFAGKTVVLGVSGGIAAYKARTVDIDADAFDFTGIAWFGRGRAISIAVSPRAFLDLRGLAPSTAPRPYLGLGSNAVPQQRPITAVADSCDWPLAVWQRPVKPDELLFAARTIGGASVVKTGTSFTDAALLAVDLDDAGGDFLAGLEHVLHLVHAVFLDLRDVDQAVDAILDLEFDQLLQVIPRHRSLEERGDQGRMGTHESAGAEGTARGGGTGRGHWAGRDHGNNRPLPKETNPKTPPGGPNPA